jgi:hypothetical protein
MTSRKLIVFSLIIGCALPLLAQSGEKYKARLAPVPALVNAKTIPITTVAGIGSSSATLNGSKLTIAGTYEKMASAATVARVHISPITGVRGAAILDLTVSRTGDGKTGTIAGSFDLTAEQVDALRKGRLYIQIHSEGAPAGHLMGWLLR